MKPLKEFKKTIIVFGDILGSSSSRFLDQCFKRRRHNNLDIFYLSQSYFDLPEITLKNDSNKLILFIQTLKDIKNI